MPILDVAGYAEATIHVLPHVHVLPGLRFEQIRWDVDDRNPATRSDPTTTTSGSASRALVLPKLSVEAELTPRLDVFANAGSGFHSNDARAAVASHGDGALARGLGGEAGLRTTAVPHARLSADLWYLHLDSELVWSGDTGGTEPSGPTRRYGVDLEAALQPAAVAAARRQPQPRALDAGAQRRQRQRPRAGAQADGAGRRDGDPRAGVRRAARARHRRPPGQRRPAR